MPRPRLSPRFRFPSRSCRPRRGLAWLVLAGGLLVVPPLGAQSSSGDPKYRQDYESRLSTVQAMRDALRREAAASGKDVGGVLRDVADSERRAAKLAEAADYRGALEVLETGYRGLRGALTGLKAGSSPALPSGSAALEAAAPANDEKLRSEVGQRQRSTRVLRDALLRLDAPGNATLVAQADAALAEADRLLAAGNYGAAREAVERAYQSIKQATISQRDHTEVVASKKFATPREEYAYELTRNDDYLRLGQAVLARGELSAGGRTALDKAAALRQAAEAAARAERWGDGIKALEAATLECKQVVREAGFNVP